VIGSRAGLLPPLPAAQGQCHRAQPDQAADSCCSENIRLMLPVRTDVERSVSLGRGVQGCKSALVFRLTQPFAPPALPRIRIVDIETIDITGSGDNILALDQAEVLNLSSNSNTLTVIGNSGDRVNFDTEWGRHSDLGGFQVFTKGAATLRVSIGVPVVLVP
jgi:hypothetical protein